MNRVYSVHCVFRDRRVTQSTQRTQETHHATDAIDARRGMHPDRVVWAVVVASRYVPMSTCLTQALAAQVLLARRGYSAHLHIGVAKEGAEAKLKAHAWVESDGKVLIGSSEPG